MRGRDDDLPTGVSEASTRARTGGVVVDADAGVQLLVELADPVVGPRRSTTENSGVTPSSRTKTGRPGRAVDAGVEDRPASHQPPERRLEQLRVDRSLEVDDAHEMTTRLLLHRVEDVLGGAELPHPLDGGDVALFVH